MNSTLLEIPELLELTYGSKFHEMQAPDYTYSLMRVNSTNNEC